MDELPRMDFRSRKAHNIKKGGGMNMGIGDGDEFVLINAARVSGGVPSSSPWAIARAAQVRRSSSPDRKKNSSRISLASALRSAARRSGQRSMPAAGQPAEARRVAEN